MRTKCTFHTDWQFTKPGAAPVAVTLPHTWNALPPATATLRKMSECPKPSSARWKNAAAIPTEAGG